MLSIRLSNWRRGRCKIWSSHPIAVGTENNIILVPFASESAGAIVKCVAISSWTSLLENGWVIGRLTSIWICKFSTAAILVQLECLASTPTPDYPLVLIASYYLKFFRATYTIAFFLLYMRHHHIHLVVERVMANCSHQPCWYHSSLVHCLHQMWSQTVR